MAALDNFKKMLGDGKDSALLRYSLGMEYLKLNDLSEAIHHLNQAVKLDPNYSAAWKHLGRAYEMSHDLTQAAEIYSKGIKIAEEKGDKQTAKEMSVFLRRLNKNLI